MTPGPVRVLAGAFCLGLYAVVTQVSLTRELLVVFSGNELVIGTILGCWLAAIGMGASLARRLTRYAWFDAYAAAMLCGLCVCMGLALPWQVMGIRVSHAVAGVPMGEYASYRVALWTASLACLPSCVPIGFAFPLATALAARSEAAGAPPAAGPRELPVTWVYVWEAVGGTVGGAALTFVLLRVLGPLQIVAVGMAAIFGGAAVLAPRRVVAYAAAALAALVLGVAGTPRLHGRLASAAARVRWQSLGIVTVGSRGGPRLAAERDTVYQNLAVTELSGQYALYGNGELAFAFPDPYGDAYRVHVVMAQNPRAEAVLVLGGNPAGEVVELLKYPLRRLVSVDLDPGVRQILRELQPTRMAAADADERLTHVTGDAVAYLRACGERFDVVLVLAPAPSTAAANRFYTTDFYRLVRRVLTPRGFLYTAVASSERLQDAAAAPAASVFGALRAVFPRVLVTAGGESRFFAAGDDGDITLDAETLYGRSAGTPIGAAHFQAAYLLGWDDIAPEKVAHARERLAAVSAPVNTTLHPAAYLRQVALWFRFSGSGGHGVLERMSRLETGRLTAGVVLFGVLVAAIALALRLAGGRCGAVARGWGRGAIMAAIALTGFAGMALELALVFVFQSVFGAVYTHLGFIVAVFMLGLVAGAMAGRVLARRGGRATWLGLGGVATAPLVLVAILPLVVEALVGGYGDTRVVLGAGVIYAFVGIAGGAVGAAFVLANAVLQMLGSDARRAAAATDAADHLGAAAGAFVTGALLLPALGLARACVVLAAWQGLAVWCVLCARLTTRRRG